MATETHVVCQLADLEAGSRIIVEVGDRSIGVFNIDGELYGVLNVCPHKGAPLCRGTVDGTMLPSEPQQYVFSPEQRFLRCPWHGWEIDIATGAPKWNHARGRVPTYPVRVENGEVVVEV